jgi:hypothetical protein
VTWIAIISSDVEMLGEIRPDRFRGHEHQRDVLRLAGRKISLGDVPDVLADVGAHALARGLARLFATRLPERGEGFKREFGVEGEHARVAGEADDAIGPRAAGERELKFVGACRQAVAHDRLHAPLAESAARLLVRQNVLQRNDLLGHARQPGVCGVDHRQPLVELAQIVAGGPGVGLQPIAQALTHMVQPFRNQPREIGLTRAQPIAERPYSPIQLDAGLCERSDTRVRFALALCVLPPGAPTRQGEH